jgi:hypothetical protein
MSSKTGCCGSTLRASLIFFNLFSFLVLAAIFSLIGFIRWSPSGLHLNHLIYELIKNHTSNVTDDGLNTANMYQLYINFSVYILVITGVEMGICLVGMLAACTANRVVLVFYALCVVLTFLATLGWFVYYLASMAVSGSLPLVSVTFYVSVAVVLVVQLLSGVAVTGLMRSVRLHRMKREDEIELA